jgi:hypothetical protein
MTREPSDQPTRGEDPEEGGSGDPAPTAEASGHAAAVEGPAAHHGRREEAAEPGAGAQGEDEAYYGHVLSRLNELGLGEHLFPLPFPDEEVMRTIELRLLWLRKTGSITEVRELIDTDPRWPRPGRIPVTRHSVYRRGMEVRWHRATRQRLREWFGSPSIYGVYSTVTSLPGGATPGDGARRRGDASRDRAESTGAGAAPGSAGPHAHASFGRDGGPLRHTILDAFPSFATLEDREKFSAAVLRPDRPRTQAAGSRWHGLPFVYCAHVLPEGSDPRVIKRRTSRKRRRTGRRGGAAALAWFTDADAATAQPVRCPTRGDGLTPTASGDTVCANRLYPSTGPRANGKRQYIGRGCQSLAHVTTAPGTLDAVVRQLLVSAFSPGAVRAAIDRAWLEGPSARESAAKLEAQLAELEALIEAAEESEERARAAGETQKEARAAARAKRYEQRAEPLRRQVEQLRRGASESDRLSAADAARVLALATDLGEVFELAAQVEGGVRRVMRALLRRVWLRRSGALVDVGLEYPSGRVEWHVVLTRRVHATDAERAFACGRHAQGATEEQIARELNSQGDRRTTYDTWTPARVRTLLDAEKAEHHGEADAVEEGAADRPRRKSCAPSRSTRHAVLAPFEHERHGQDGTPDEVPWETVPQLALRVGAPEVAVQRLVLRGVLGTSRWDGRTLRVRPRGRALHRQFRDFGRRDLAGRLGWPEADTISVQDAMRRTGRSFGLITEVARGGSGVGVDLADRHFVRWSEVEVGLIDRRPLRKRPPKGAE